MEKIQNRECDCICHRHWDVDRGICTENLKKKNLRESGLIGKSKMQKITLIKRPIATNHENKMLEANEILGKFFIKNRCCSYDVFSHF